MHGSESLVLSPAGKIKNLEFSKRFVRENIGSP